MKKTIITLMLLSISSMALAGGGWTKKQGEAYVKLYEWWLSADQHYTDNGALDPNITSSIYNTNLYIEYGLTDKIEVGLHLPLFSRAIMNNQVSSVNGEIISPGDELNGIGDLDLMVKYALLKGNGLNVAASVTFGLPTGNSSGGDSGVLQTGDGASNQLIKIDASKSLPFNEVNAYISAFVGYNLQSQGFSDEWRFGGELGLGLLESKLWLRAKVNVQQSTKNGERPASSNGLFANNTEFVSLGLEADYFFSERLGISAGFASAVSGRIIYAAPSYQVGVFLKW